MESKTGVDRRDSGCYNTTCDWHCVAALRSKKLISKDNLEALLFLLFVSGVLLRSVFWCFCFPVCEICVWPVQAAQSVEAGAKESVVLSDKVTSLGKKWMRICPLWRFCRPHCVQDPDMTLGEVQHV